MLLKNIPSSTISTAFWTPSLEVMPKLAISGNMFVARSDDKRMAGPYPNVPTKWFYRFFDLLLSNVSVVLLL